MRLVECKRFIKGEKELQGAVDQAHSYALWVIPAYYVITDGQMVSVWDFQGAIAPDTGKCCGCTGASWPRASRIFTPG